MSTLVTGGTGFVGANIVRELARAGHEVVSYDISSADGLVRQFVADWEGAITFVQGDIRDGEAVSALANGYGIDKIIHAATYTVNQHELEVERGRDVVGINVEGLANVLELARIASVGRFLYVSSGAAYGTAGGTDQTYSEDMPVSPEVMYAVTKYAGELITRRYGALHGFSTVSVRLSTPYGPMERVTGHRAVMSALYQWTGQIARGRAAVGAGGVLRPGGRARLHVLGGHGPRAAGDSRCPGAGARPLQPDDRRVDNVPRDPGGTGRTGPRQRSVSVSVSVFGRGWRRSGGSSTVVRAVAGTAFRPPPAAGPGLASGPRPAGGAGRLPAVAAGYRVQRVN